jgi:hypothetical protein
LGVGRKANDLALKNQNTLAKSKEVRTGWSDLVDKVTVSPKKSYGSRKGCFAVMIHAGQVNSIDLCVLFRGIVALAG